MRDPGGFLSVRDFCRDRVYSVFIDDSNSLIINTDEFVEILNVLYASFPRLERVTSYARARTLYKKPASDLKQLRQAGLTRLHVGLATGNAELLKKINKGLTPDEAVGS
ncbi:MAG: radical SAM protein, partial [Pseudomonadota bacterium]